MEYKKVQGKGFEHKITGENMCFLLLTISRNPGYVEVSETHIETARFLSNLQFHTCSFHFFVIL